MNRVLEIEEAVSGLLDLDEISLLQYPQWNDLAEDIIRKLRHVHTHCLESSRASLLTPPVQRAVFIVTDVFSSTSSSDYSSHPSPYEAAAQAFDRQIYSRCIKIVEAAALPLEMSMVSLAHHSYAAIVEDSEDVEDSAKFALWWCQFLERTEPTRAVNEKTEILDYWLVALERLFQLEPSRRKNTSANLLKISTKCYKLASANVRAFHSKCLRKLEKLVYWIDETRSYCEGYPEFTEAEALAVEAIKTSLRDQKRFEAETGTNRKDIDYAMCCDLLSSLAIRTSSEDDQLSQSPKDIENLMEKIFLDENDSGYVTLPRSDTEEDIVLRL